MSAVASPEPTVAIVGGGLAGLAAAAALGSSGCRVTLFEARSLLGGRASSFRDPSSGELVDQCQHVSMGCCTNLADFCRRVGIDDCFRQDRELTFIGPDGSRCRMRGASWLPAPLHLAPSFLRLNYLPLRDRARIAWALWRLMRLPAGDLENMTIGSWLARQGQSRAALDHFWSVILVSALSEDLKRASLAAARKVLVDGFLAANEAYVLQVPQVPLGELYGQRLQQWFASHDIELRTSAIVRRVSCEAGLCLETADGGQSRPDFLILAVPWSKIEDLMCPPLAGTVPQLRDLCRFEAVPITAVHLWFDRPIMSLPHAVLVGRLAQWVFNRGAPKANDEAAGHYYQIVISQSRGLAQSERDEIIETVRGELAEVWPQSRSARVLRALAVTEHGAVFSAKPGLDSTRPSQRTAQRGLVLAGDWTSTGWPATMEGAVRSGYLAAEAVMESIGRPQRFLVPDLPRGWLARLLIRD
jgi:squalene-associated FAD-dependent desaturase